MGFFKHLFSSRREAKTKAPGGRPAAADSAGGELPCRPPNVTGSWVPAQAAREDPRTVKARIMEMRRVSARRVEVDPDRCTACGHCADVCPDGAITVTSTKVIDPELCSTCGCCVSTCPNGAIRIAEEKAAPPSPA